MTGSSSGGASITPAKVAFLALYSSSLRVNKEQDEEEIAYFRSVALEDEHTPTSQPKAVSRETRDVNWQLRQIGLARGIVQFAAELSEGRPAESVETEKTRIITRELEPDWWLLACIDLTRITTPQKGARAGPKTEYSAREVAPPEVLLQQCTRAHRAFLLHHAPSLSEFFVRVKREKFTFCLAKFWDHFLEEWDPLVHGSPSTELYDAIPLGVRGELGSGAAKDGPNGSEEREIVEGFVSRTEGLVDMVIVRCAGIAPTLPPYPTRPESAQDDSGVAHADGTIFSGTGALSRRCIRSVAGWIDDVGRRGIDAYGILENPSANPRRKKGRAYDPYASFSARSVRERVSPSKEDASEFKIPAPIVGSLPQRVKPGAESTQKDAINTKSTHVTHETLDQSGGADGAKAGNEVVKYLTLGIYGSTWGIPSGRPATDQTSPDKVSTQQDLLAADEPFPGYFLIGLLGDLDESWLASQTPNPEIASQVRAELDSRISVRHLHVERTLPTAADTEQQEDTALQGRSRYERVRVVVYVQAPFIFTMLFDEHTDALAMPSFYRSLHHQLGPLRSSLLIRTDPETHTHTKPGSAAAPARTAEPIYSLVYDPEKLTVHATIPPIPPLHNVHESAYVGTQGSALRAVSSSSSTTTSSSRLGSTGWTRFEALAIHQQMLNVYLSTRRRPMEVERTCKTSRGWWMVWMRIPPLLPLADAHTADTQSQASAKDEDASDTAYREAFLLRKASDYRAVQPRKTTGSSFGGFGFGFGGSRSTPSSATQSHNKNIASPLSSRGNTGRGAGGGGGGWTQGIGVDARQYIESLLSLSR